VLTNKKLRVNPNQGPFFRKVAFGILESDLTNFLNFKVFETFEIKKGFHFQTWQTKVVGL